MLAYSKGYYYKVDEEYSIFIPILGYMIDTPYYYLNPKGLLGLKINYAWNGPTFYFKLDGLIRPSAIHDVLCQMMREGQLPHNLYKKVNEIFYNECLKSGINRLHASIIKLAVDIFKPGNPNKGVVHPTLYIK